MQKTFVTKITIMYQITILIVSLLLAIQFRLPTKTVNIRFDKTDMIRITEKQRNSLRHLGLSELYSIQGNQLRPAKNLVFFVSRHGKSLTFYATPITQDLKDYMIFKVNKSLWESDMLNVMVYCRICSAYGCRLYYKDCRIDHLKNGLHCPIVRPCGCEPADACQMHTYNLVTQKTTVVSSELFM